MNADNNHMTGSSQSYATRINNESQMEEGIVPVAHPHVQSPSATHSENVANNTCTLNAGGPINSNGTPVGNENDSTVHTNPTVILYNPNSPTDPGL